MAEPSVSDTPMKATCHCGAITLTATRKPPEPINECQCTICRRYGAAWGYYDSKEITLTIKPGSSTRAYSWGDKKLDFGFCDTCGCVMYWCPTGCGAKFEAGFGMAINTRMVDPDELRFVNRIVSNDMLCEPLNDKGTAHAEDKASY